MPILADSTYATYNLNPFMTLLPNGLVMVIAGRLTRFYRCPASPEDHLAPLHAWAAASLTRSCTLDGMLSEQAVNVQ